MFKRILSVMALLVLIPFFQVYSLREIEFFTGIWLLLSGTAKVWTIIRGTGLNPASILAPILWVLLLATVVLGSPEPGNTSPSGPLTAAGYAVMLGWPLVDCLNILLPDPKKK